MKNKILIAIIIAIAATGCVQKSYVHTIKLELTINNKKDIKKVGVRGEENQGNPLNWNSDLPMNEVIKDSLYTVTFKIESGYKFAEIKFVVDDEWELKDQPNRRITFSDKSDTTFLNLTFDKP
ncbi:MAG: hypothetical protein NTZ59_06755 [Bacteroidetes bacterium]|jgi:hypothetical protein|nr:hypothetical protein [Bacteroidota bacterium]